MKTYLMLASTLIVGLLSAPTFAIKIDMTPGLWEHSFTMTSKNGEIEKAMKEMQAQMANMPADQRKLVEDMLAAQGVGISKDGSSVKICMTQAQIDSGNLPQKGDDCTQEIVEQSKNKYQITFSCAGDPPSRGTGEIHFSSSKAYTGKSTFVTTVNGAQEEMAMDQRGKWLSADCGNIKPAD